MGGQTTSLGGSIYNDRERSGAKQDKLTSIRNNMGSMATVVLLFHGTKFDNKKYKYRK